MCTRLACGVFGLLAVSLSVAAAFAQTADQRTVIEWMHAGRDAAVHGDLKAAEGSFRKVVAAVPTLSDGFLGLGMVELREGEADAAIQSLQHAISLNPQLKGAHLLLGMAQSQAGDAAAAAESLRGEIALQPDDLEALTWLGIVELGQGHAAEASVALDHAAALAPNDANVLYYRGRAHLQVAEESYRRMREMDPDSAFVHRALGDTLANSGQPEKAIEEYEAAIQKQPNNADLYEALGEQQQKIARFDAAQVSYTKELRLNPNSAIALYNLGRIDVEHGHAAEGVPLLRQAQQAHALAAPTAFYLGLGLAETGNPGEAARWLEAAVRSEPSPFIAQSAYYQLARVYQRLNRREDAERALAQLKRLKEEAAKNVTAGGAAQGAPVQAGGSAAP